VPNIPAESELPSFFDDELLARYRKAGRRRHAASAVALGTSRIDVISTQPASLQAVMRPGSRCGPPRGMLNVRNADWPIRTAEISVNPPIRDPSGAAALDRRDRKPGMVSQFAMFRMSPRAEIRCLAAENPRAVVFCGYTGRDERGRIHATTRTLRS
jgi:hypothetical protein